MSGTRGSPATPRTMSIDRGRSRLRGEGSIASRTDSLPADLRKKASIVEDVNPFVEFPSLRRGFTLNGQPIISELRSTAGSALVMEEKVAVVKVQEDSNAYFFWAIYLTLLLIAAGNLVTTLVIMNVLRIGPEGMEAIEFQPLDNVIKFFGNADLGHVYQHNGVISSFAGEDLRVVGEEASVTLQAHKDDLQPPRVRLSRAGVSVENVHDLSLLHPDTGEVVFSTSDPELRLPEGVRHLETEETEVDRVVSGVEADEAMMVRSDRKLTVRGAEGVAVEGKQVSLTSAEDISVTSVQGAVRLEAGVTMDTVMLPHGGVQGYQGETGQYKLCVCMPSGRLFKVAVPDDNYQRPPSSQVGCHSVLDTDLDPCV